MNATETHHVLKQSHSISPSPQALSFPFLFFFFFFLSSKSEPARFFVMKIRARVVRDTELANASVLDGGWRSATEHKLVDPGQLSLTSRRMFERFE